MDSHLAFPRHLFHFMMKSSTKVRIHFEAPDVLRPRLGKHTGPEVNQCLPAKSLFGDDA